MSGLEIISIIATFLGVTCFSIVFTILYRSYVKSTVVQMESGKRDIELIDMALNERRKKTIRRRKVGSAVKTALFTLLVIIVTPLIIFSVINRVAGYRPIFGKTFIVVASGSMSFKNDVNEYLETNGLDNQFQKYDVLVLDKVKSAAELKVYDIIAYKNDKGVIIIHRIIRISGTGDGTEFTTRGDANSGDDEYRPQLGDVIGVYRGAHMRLFGIVVLFMQSWSGIITMTALLYCLCMIDRVSRKIENVEKKRLDQLFSAIESEEFSAKAMRAEFKETIYYRGYAYRFDETGFLDKEEYVDETLEEDTMLKVYDDGTPSQKITIETRKDHGDGKEE